MVSRFLPSMTGHDRKCQKHPEVENKMSQFRHSKKLVLTIKLIVISSATIKSRVMPYYFAFFFIGDVTIRPAPFLFQ
jgi:hypothetical protein